MSLSTVMIALTDSFIQEFTKRIASKYDLEQEELLTLWNEIDKDNVEVPITISTSSEQPVKKSSKKSKKSETSPKTKKTTPYINYMKSIRSSIKEENPSFNFAQISKEIGRRWKELSVDEKNQYKVEDVPTETVEMTETVQEKTPKKTSQKKSKKDKTEVLELRTRDVPKTPEEDLLFVLDNVPKMFKESHSNPLNHELQQEESEEEDNPTSEKDSDSDYQPSESDDDNDSVISTCFNYGKKKITPTNDICFEDEENLYEKSEEEEETENKKIQPKPDYASMSKPELVKLCIEHNLNSKGKKQDLAERLMAM
jgi:hypothetical protein